MPQTEFGLHQDKNGYPDQKTKPGLPQAGWLSALPGFALVPHLHFLAAKCSD